MSRPETINDLPEKDRRVLVARIEPALLENLNAKEVGALLQVREVFTDVFQGETTRGTTSYYRPLSEAEEQDKLSNAQGYWDTWQYEYECANAGEITPGWMRRYVDEHAEAEGLDPIDWDALDAAEPEEACE